MFQARESFESKYEIIRGGETSNTISNMRSNSNKRNNTVGMRKTNSIKKH